MTDNKPNLFDDDEGDYDPERSGTVAMDIKKGVDMIEQPIKLDQIDEDEDDNILNQQQPTADETE